MHVERSVLLLVQVARTRTIAAVLGFIHSSHKSVDRQYYVPQYYVV